MPALAALVGLAYAGAHLGWYRGTPSGQFPVVDEQENLVLAEAIVRGELPRGFRLPLAALLVVLTGGAMANPLIWRNWRSGWDEAPVRLVAAHLGLRSPDGQPPGDQRRATEILRMLFQPPSPTP